MKLFYNYNSIDRIYLQTTGTFIIHPYINLTLANGTYYLFNSNSEPYGFVQTCKVKEKFYIQEKSLLKREKKKSFKNKQTKNQT